MTALRGIFIQLHLLKRSLVDPELLLCSACKVRIRGDPIGFYKAMNVA